MKVSDLLTIDVPEFINNPDKQTHLYLLPKNAQSKIETNKKTQLSMGYSMQSVYDYSSNQNIYK